MKTKKPLIIAGVFAVGFISFLISAKFSSPIKSTPVNYLKNQLSSAQLSYFGRLDSTNVAYNSMIKIDTGTTVAPSTANYNLFIGDTIAIANSAGGGSALYTVRDVADTNAVFIYPALDNNNAFAGAYVIATRSAIHHVSFSPTTSVTGGKWEVLIKATSLAGENPSDGMPDQGGFDAVNLTASDVTCPWGATASVGTTAVLTTGVSPSAIGTYHIITCSLAVGGTNPIDIGVTGTIVIGGANQLINPAPAPGHTVGQASAAADTHTFLVRHLDSASTIIDNDTSLGKIALTESVRVTAVIDPTITFYVDPAGTNTAGVVRCGNALSAGAPQTTATSVNFGSLSLGQFNDLAQRFTCSTNAVNGYVVQVFETTPLTITSAGSTSTIPDTTCDPATACTIDTPNTWNADVSNSKFGYSLEAINSSPVTFSHNSVFNAKPFGVGYPNARPIMSRNTTPTAEDRGYICYRITASNFQEAGTYQNQVNFIATATF